MRPIYDSVLQEAWLAGLIPSADKNPPLELFKPKVGWPAWGYVDPTKEVVAEIKAINASLTSPQRVTAEHGLDWEEVLVERALFEKRKKELEEEHGISIPVGTLTSRTGTVPDDGDGED